MNTPVPRPDANTPAHQVPLPISQGPSTSPSGKSLSRGQHLLEIEEQQKMRSEHMKRQRIWDQATVPLLHCTALARELVWPGQVEQQCRSVVEDGGLLTLLGRSGTGKTQLAAKLLHQACFVHGKTVRYVRADDLFEKLTNDVAEGHRGRALGTFARIGVLAIDELSQRSGTAFEQHQLSRLIDKRYSGVLPTILIANLTSDEFAALVGPGVVSRMQEVGSVVECDWASQRKLAMTQRNGRDGSRVGVDGGGGGV